MSDWEDKPMVVGLVTPAEYDELPEPKTVSYAAWLGMSKLVTELSAELAALRSKVAELDAVNVGLAQESHDLQQICRDAYEVWAGSEDIPIPQTAAEAYLLQLLEQMRDEVKRGLK